MESWRQRFRNGKNLGSRNFLDFVVNAKTVIVLLLGCYLLFFPQIVM